MLNAQWTIFCNFAFMKRHIYIILIVAFALISCKREKRHADLTGIEFDIKIERFDSAFWTLDTMRVEEEFARLKAEQPDITPIYTETVVRFGHPDSAITHNTYKLFRANKEVGELYEDALKIYTDMSDIEALAKRIILIGKGQVLYDGSLKKLKSKYGNNKYLNITTK